MAEPETEAGRRLLDAIRSGVAGLFARTDTFEIPGPNDDDPVRDLILAIEAKARADLLTELRAAVEGLPGRRAVTITDPDGTWADAVPRYLVFALLEPPR